MLACAEFGPSFIPKAQAELDRVVGSDRLPTFEDLEELPYVRAIVNETLRWRPIAVLGVSLPYAALCPRRADLPLLTIRRAPPMLPPRTTITTECLSPKDPPLSPTSGPSISTPTTSLILTVSTPSASWRREIIPASGATVLLDSGAGSAQACTWRRTASSSTLLGYVSRSP